MSTSNAQKLSVLVTGATGKQGGAVARELLARGHQVRALTRSPNSPAAQALAKAGAELVGGDFNDQASLERAAKGAHTVFAMGTPFEAGPGAETAQGIALVKAAKSAGVKHFVYTSVGGADQNTGIPHFESKFEVEQAVRASDMPFTILGPVFFMENLVSPWWLPGLQQGVLAMALPPGRKLQQVAVADIGRFGALVVERRESFLGKRIDLASDELSGQEAVDTLSRVSGRKLTYMETPLAQVRAASEDMARMFEWFDRVGYSANIAGLRQEHPDIDWHTFEAWARKQDWSALQR